MCACGRKATDVQTTLQAEQERQAALTQTAKENLARELDNIRASGANALANASSN